MGALVVARILDIFVASKDVAFVLSGFAAYIARHWAE
jgi:hypothetical protein